MFDGLDTTPTLLWIGDALWPVVADRARPHLARMAAGSGGRYLESDIVDAIKGGRMQLWVVLEGAALLCAVVTEIAQYPRVRAMRYVGIVGHRHKRWVHLQAKIEAAAAHHFGCQRMEALCQAGHERMLVTPGWAPWHVMMEKAL